MIIGKNWVSGSDETALSNFLAEKEEGPDLSDFKFRINNKGFLTDQGVQPSDKVSLPSVSFNAEHGYFYVGSKEFFLYSEKVAEIQDPTYTDQIPGYVEIALNAQPSEGSGIVGSGIYTIFDLSGIPHLMTPIVISPYARQGSNVIVRTSKMLNEIDRKMLEIPEGKITGLEEPIAEVFEVDSIRAVNQSQNSIVNPSLYVYDNLTGKIFVKGALPRSLIEYEESNTKEVKFGKFFSASVVGKRSGLLTLTSGSIGTAALRFVRRDISLEGNNLFIQQDPTESTIVTIHTKYTDPNGREFDYITIDNNLGFALISTDLIETDIYLGSVQVSRTDAYGFAHVPIAAYLAPGSHKSIVVKGNSRVSVVPRTLLPIACEVKITLQNAVNLSDIDNQILVLQPNVSEVGFSSVESRGFYVEPGTDHVLLSDLFSLTGIRFTSLHGSYNSTKQKGSIHGFGILDGSSSLGILIEPVDTAGMILYQATTMSVITPNGMGIYGVH